MLVTVKGPNLPRARNYSPGSSHSPPPPLHARGPPLKILPRPRVLICKPSRSYHGLANAVPDGAVSTWRINAVRR
jgi:hypothetical protein